MSLHTRSVAELGKGLQNRQFSSVELTGALLERVRASQPALNAFITVTADQALAQAAAADAEPARLRATHPRMVRWRARPTPMAPAGTSSVMTDPAAV